MLSRYTPRVAVYDVVNCLIPLYRVYIFILRDGWVIDRPYRSLHSSASRQRSPRLMGNRPGGKHWLVVVACFGKSSRCQHGTQN